MSPRGVGGLEGKKLKFLRTFVAASVYAACGSVYAQNLATLEPVVVSASKVSEPQGQATVLVEVINRQQIESSGAVNVTELLDQVSGGLLTRQYGRLGVDAAFDLGYLGGASAQRTLVLIDGARTNDIDDSTVHWSQLPIDAIEQVEIRKAGGGVLFGDRALGGVVNIITKREQDSGNAHVTVGSFGTRVVGLHKAARFNETSWRVSAQQAETDGYREGGKQELQSGQFGISQATQLGLFDVAIRASKEDVDRPAAISLSTFEENPRVASLTSPGYFYAARRNGRAIDLTWRMDHGNAEETLSRITRDTSESRATYLSPTFIGEPIIYENERDTLEIRRSDRVLSGRLISGLEYVDARSSSNRSERARVEQVSSSVYASAEFPIEMSTVNTGVRRQFIENRFLNTSTSAAEIAKQSLTSWSLGGITPVFSGQLRANIQSSFAFPTADQLYTYSARWQDSFAPLDIFPGVKAMRSNEMQIAYAQRLSSSGFQAGVRHILIKDEIGERLNCQGIDISCNTNLYDTRRSIFFFAAQGRLTRDFSWSLNADRIESEITSGAFVGSEVPMVPGMVAKAALSFSRGQNLYRLMANYRSDMIQSGDNANTKFRIPARLTMDAGYTFSWQSQRRELSLWVRNLTDRQYFDFAAWDGYSSGVSPADGRSIDLRFKQSF